MYIIYFYIIIRYLIVIGLVVTAICFLITIIKKQNTALLIGVIAPVLVVVFMFSYGVIRKPAVDFEDLCVNFDNLYNQDNIDCSSCFVSFLQLSEDDNESLYYILENEKLLSGTIDNVQYYATYMHSDMLDFKNLYTYCGNYDGQIYLIKEDKIIVVDYILRTNQKDPRVIFYSIKPSKIKISDYL